MNQYLLLRDNKQSGPYSVEELQQKGLKPYDLVWLDGKSAAWRYPSEIAELKAFAPVVEEQPYDRFYKKQTATKTNTASVNTPQLPVPVHADSVAHSAAVVVNIPVTTATTQPVISTNKIYVTLPAGMGGKASTIQPANTQPAVSPVDKATAEQAAAADKQLNDKFARLREEKIRQAALKKAQSGAAVHQPAAEKTAQPRTQSDAVVKEAIPTTAFTVVVEQAPPQPAGQPAPVVHYRPVNNKLVMRSIAAACLLLAGVIIGLVISNRRQQRDHAALDQLVKQIQERDRQKRDAAQFAVTTTQATADAPITDEAVPADLPPQQAEQKPVAPAGNKRENLVVKESTPVKDVSARQTVKVIPAVVSARAEETAAGGHEVEKARKSIHQQVAVDANKYKIGVLGGISELQLTLSNNSLYPLDQVEVEIRYLGPEKRVIKTQMLLFNDLAPGEQKTIEAPRTNRGVSVDYVITRINSKALGLAHAGY